MTFLIIYSTNIGSYSYLIVFSFYLKSLAKVSCDIWVGFALSTLLLHFCESHPCWKKYMKHISALSKCCLFVLVFCLALHFRRLHWTNHDEVTFAKYSFSMNSAQTHHSVTQCNLCSKERKQTKSSACSSFVRGNMSLTLSWLQDFRSVLARVNKSPWSWLSVCCRKTSLILHVEPQLTVSSTRQKDGRIVLFKTAAHCKFSGC